MEASLKRHTLGNMALTASARGITLALQLGANVVLARALSSADYGVVGYAQIFISFLSLVSEFGLGSAAIQRQRLTDAELHTGFTLRMLFGLLAFVLALVGAPWCALLLGQPEVAGVMKLLAVGFLINGMAFVPGVRAMRALDYRRFTGAQVAGSVVNAGVTVWMALHGHAFWSIVVANVAGVAATTLALNLLFRERLRLALDRDSARHYANFGGHLFVVWVLTFIIMSLDNFVIGTVLGSVTLGYYALAYSWGSKLCETLSTVVNNVLFPTFAKIQSDLPSLRSAYLKSLEFVGFLAVLGYATLFAVSDDFLIYILGAGTNKWQPAIGALQVLCIYGLIRAVLEPVGTVVMAVGGLPVMVRANLSAAVVKVVLVYPALMVFGIEGVAVVVTLSYTAQYFVFLPALKRHLSLGPVIFFGPLWRPLLSGAIMLAAIAALRGAAFVGAGAQRFWLSLSLCVVLYVAIFGLLSRGSAYIELYRLIRARSGVA